MKIINYYLEFLQKNKESFAVDSFPKRAIIKKKKRTVVIEKGSKK
jgi:hypothetical protein